MITTMVYHLDIIAVQNILQYVQHCNYNEPTVYSDLVRVRVIVRCVYLPILLLYEYNNNS